MPSADCYTQEFGSDMLRHINLHLDCFIATADPNDLRAIIRNLLCTEPSTLTTKFTSLAQDYISQRRLNLPSPQPSRLYQKVWDFPDPTSTTKEDHDHQGVQVEAASTASSSTAASASAPSSSSSAVSPYTPPETRAPSPVTGDAPITGITSKSQKQQNVPTLTATRPPGVYNNRRFKYINPSPSNAYEPTEIFYDEISRARSVFTCGMGVEAIPILTHLVRASGGIPCPRDSRVEGALALLDADTAQAIQSCKEQLDDAVIKFRRTGVLDYDVSAAKAALEDLRAALVENKAFAKSRREHFNLERADLQAGDWDDLYKQKLFAPRRRRSQDQLVLVAAAS